MHADLVAAAAAVAATIVCWDDTSELTWAAAAKAASATSWASVSEGGWGGVKDRVNQCTVRNETASRCFAWDHSNAPDTALGGA